MRGLPLSGDGDLEGIVMMCCVALGRNARDRVFTKMRVEAGALVSSFKQQRNQQREIQLSKAAKLKGD